MKVGIGYGRQVVRSERRKGGRGCTQGGRVGGEGWEDGSERNVRSFVTYKMPASSHPLPRIIGASTSYVYGKYILLSSIELFDADNTINIFKVYRFGFDIKLNIISRVSRFQQCF